MLTFEEWQKAQPKIRVIDALDMVWRGLCMDEECPNYRWPKPGAKIRVKLPDDWKKLTQETR